MDPNETFVGAHFGDGSRFSNFRVVFATASERVAVRVVFLLAISFCTRKAAINSFDYVFFVVSTGLAVAASVFGSIWIMFKIS